MPAKTKILSNSSAWPARPCAKCQSIPRWHSALLVQTSSLNSRIFSALLMSLTLKLLETRHLRRVITRLPRSFSAVSRTGASWQPRSSTSRTTKLLLRRPGRPTRSRVSLTFFFAYAIRLTCIVWRQVNEACVAKKEFRLAQICGLNLIVHAEELSELVKQYERNGYFDELISLLEAGLGLERAHMGMFTSLGVALTKYHPERVMEHLRLFWSRTNLPKMIRATEEAHLWPELIFLYVHYDEFDNAALAMMERASDAWEHQAFKDIIVKASNVEIYYRALGFYLEEQPTLLTDLLQALTPRIDVNRVVRMFIKSDNVPLIKPFLLNVQSQNKRDVNNALNDLLIEEEDYKTLRDSVNNNDNYDAMELAQRLEKHELVFFRQIAADIYRKNKRWEKSITLSKQDKLFKDAIETSAISQKSEIVEDLLRYVSILMPMSLFVAANASSSLSTLAAASVMWACSTLVMISFAQMSSWRCHGATVSMISRCLT